MKLRLKDDSLRLRLAQAEISELAAGRAVESRTRFGLQQALVVQLQPSDNLDAACADLSGQTLSVRAPRAELMRWAASQEVSLRGAQDLGDGALSILIEKDFQCLAPRPDEDESDLFPHPDVDGKHANCDAD